MTELIVSGVYQDVKRIALQRISSSSQRVYNQTYHAWEAFCDHQDVPPIQITPGNVQRFLSQEGITKNTMRRHLSAFRKLAHVLAVDYRNPQHHALYNALKLAKPPTDDAIQSQRRKRALSTAEANALLSIWQGHSAVSKRNKALLELLLATGLRRTESVSLRWSDVDLVNGVLYLRERKNQDQGGSVTIYNDSAIHALRAWRGVCQAHAVSPVMPVINNLHEPIQKAMSGDNVYRIVVDTANLAEVDARPHDLRRTLLTDLLRQGVPIADVQAQAGHVEESTTLLYAQATQAEHRREQARTSYGHNDVS